MPIAEAVGVRKGWLQVFPPWIATSVAKAKSLMIVQTTTFNGYTSKKDSLAKIVESVDPDILALCETKKAWGIKEDELSAYEIIEKPLKVGKEGLPTFRGQSPISAISLLSVSQKPSQL